MTQLAPSVCARLLSLTVPSRDGSPPPFRVGEGVEALVPTGSAPGEVVITVHELAQEASSRLTHGPVTILPPWGGRRGGCSSREDLPLEIVPPADASQLAVLVPMVAITVDGSRRFREEFFSNWDPHLVVTFGGDLLGAHAIFDCARVVLEPRVGATGLSRHFPMDVTNRRRLHDQRGAHRLSERSVGVHADIGKRRRRTAASFRSAPPGHVP